MSIFSAHFYFLSIISNTLAGLILSMDYLAEKIPSLKKLHEFFSHMGSKFTIGLITIIIGIFKLFVPFGTIVVIDDFFPAICGLGIGSLLLLDAFKKRVEVEDNSMEKIDALILKRKVFFGIGSIILAFLHFLFAGVIFF